MEQKKVSQKSRLVSQAKPRQVRRVVAPARKAPVRKHKVPEALPTKQYRESPIERFRTRVLKRPSVNEIVREPTAGGIIFRFTEGREDIEILLVQDSKNRWTIPKGHIEPGETAKNTALREASEETGLNRLRILTWLGKINFRFRRMTQVVMMTTQVYLIQSLDAKETPAKEKWMHGIKWFSFNEALDTIEYEDIEKLIIVAKKRIRLGDY